MSVLCPAQFDKHFENTYHLCKQRICVNARERGDLQIKAFVIKSIKDSDEGNSKVYQLLSFYKLFCACLHIRYYGREERQERTKNDIK